jgi:hypothetical protein
MVLISIGCWLGGIVGNWPLPLIAALFEPGKLASLPKPEWGFLNPPESLKIGHPSLYSFVMWGSIVLGLIGAGIGFASGQRLWRYLVVKKFGWMTDKEVDEFDKRDPGF